MIELPGAVNGTWNQDGVLILARQQGIEHHSASEGQTTLLHAANASAGDSGYFSPQFLPDGRHYLFSRTTRNPDRDGILVASLDTPDGAFLMQT